MGIVLVGYGPGTDIVKTHLTWEQIKFNEKTNVQYSKHKHEKFETIGEGFDRLRELTEY